MDLTQLRLEIDHIDAQLVCLFAKRMDISAQIGAYKKEHGLPVFVPGREEEKLLAVGEQAGPGLADYTKTLYQAIFELSRSYQEQMNEGEP